MGRMAALYVCTPVRHSSQWGAQRSPAVSACPTALSPCQSLPSPVYKVIDGRCYACTEYGAYEFPQQELGMLPVVQAWRRHVSEGNAAGVRWQNMENVVFMFSKCRSSCAAEGRPPQCAERQRHKSTGRPRVAAEGKPRRKQNDSSRRAAARRPRPRAAAASSITRGPPGRPPRPASRPPAPCRPARNDAARGMVECLAGEELGRSRKAQGVKARQQKCCPACAERERFRARVVPARSGTRQERASGAAFPSARPSVRLMDGRPVESA